MKLIKRGFLIILTVIILTINITIFAVKPMQIKAAVVTTAGAVGGTILWDLLMTAFVAVGAYEIYDSYDSQKNVFNEFINQIDSGTITVPDGGIIIDGWSGDGRILNPTDEGWESWKQGFKEWELIQSGGGGAPPPDDEEPPRRDEDYWQKWTNQNNFKVNGAFLGSIADFVMGIFEDKESELHKELFTDVSDYGYCGSLPVDSDGNYLYQFTYTSRIYNYYYMYENTFNRSGGSPYKYCFVAQPTTDERCKYCTSFVLYDGAVKNGVDFSGGGRIEGVSTKYNGDGSVVISTGNVVYNDYLDCTEYYWDFTTNAPIFADVDSASNYLLNGVDINALNKVSIKADAIDYTKTVPQLTNMLQPLTQPLSGTQTQPDLSVQALIDILTQIKAKTDALTNTETQITTEVHTEIIKETITEVVTKTQTETETKPAPLPEIPDIDTTGTIGEGMTRDWRLVFPFCIPFDMVDLIRTLEAEPKAPYFEVPLNIELIDFLYVFKLDLEPFSDVAKIFRLGETILFITGLMIVTGKVIKW